MLELLPTALVPEGARLYPVGPARPGLGGDAPADQRRRLVRARAPSAVRRRARVRARPAPAPLDAAPGRGTAARGSRSTRASPSSSGLRAMSTFETDKLAALMRPGAAAASRGIGRRWPRAGSASSGGCSAPSARRSSGWSACASARSASMACAAAASVRSRHPRSAASPVAVAAAAVSRRPPAAGSQQPPPRTAILPRMDDASRGDAGSSWRSTGPGRRARAASGPRRASSVGYRFCDTGLLYRAVTWLAEHRGVEVDDAVGLERARRPRWSSRRTSGPAVAGPRRRRRSHR